MNISNSPGDREVHLEPPLQWSKKDPFVREKKGFVDSIVAGQNWIIYGCYGHWCTVGTLRAGLSFGHFSGKEG